MCGDIFDKEGVCASHDKDEDAGQANQLGRQMANQLLANVVMENFEVEVVA